MMKMIQTSRLSIKNFLSGSWETMYATATLNYTINPDIRFAYSIVVYGA